MRTDNMVTVIMPTFNQQAFILRAIQSLLQQDHSNWELLVVNDGSTDNTANLIRPFLADPRIRCIHHARNMGLGHSANDALDHARGELIAYLPSDDIFFRQHLSTLASTLHDSPQAMLAYAHARHHYNKSSEGPAGGQLQLVQVMHRRTDERWTTRQELESDNLGRLFWDKLKGHRMSSGELSCEWTDHPLQRHKIMQEPEGGINRFRQYYGIRQPLRFHSTKGHLMDEQDRYAAFREKKYEASPDGLKILIVGELAYNAERILAFLEKGHRLYGLWMQDPYWYNYIGPLPFGHVEDLDPENFEEEVSRIAPDIIYGCLNWQAVPFVHHVVSRLPDIPFCWHFKEGPFICIEKGSWPQLVELYRRADGRVYCSEEMKQWFDGFLTPCKVPDLILDGDLPKKDWFNAPRSPLLSRGSGAIHTVVPGRPIGLHPQDVATLAAQNIHLHFYGEFTHGQWAEWIRKTSALAPDHLHIHANVDQEDWVAEFSRYDAGWLHYFSSNNNGEPARANWDDLNIPARMATLALAGLPMIQRSNPGHIVATAALAEKMGMGVFVEDLSDLGEKLRNRDLMHEIRNRVWEQRHLFTFDHHVDRLAGHFLRSIRNHAQRHHIRQEGKLHP